MRRSYGSGHVRDFRPTDQKRPRLPHGRERRPDGPRGDPTRPPSKPRWPKREGSPGEKTGTPGGDADGGPVALTPTRAIAQVPRDEKRRRFAAQLRRDAHSPRPARGEPPHKPFKKKDGDK